jgi:hypothetical protein
LASPPWAAVLRALDGPAALDAATVRAEIGSPTESVQRNLVVQVDEVWMRPCVAGLAEIGLDRRGHR